MDDRPSVQNCFTNESSQPAIYQFDRQFATHFPTCRLKIYETGIYEGHRFHSAAEPRYIHVRRRLFLNFRRRDVSIDVSSRCRVSIPRIELRERPESDWKTLPLPTLPPSLGICNSIVRESRNLPLLHPPVPWRDQAYKSNIENFIWMLPHRFHSSSIGELSHERRVVEQRRIRCGWNENERSEFKSNR